VFLLGKAEIAVETRQVFGPSKNFKAFLILISLREAEAKKNPLLIIEPRANDLLRCTRCGRDPMIPATFLNGLSS